MRIIGVELRVIVNGGQVSEVCLLPCNVDLPQLERNRYAQWDATIHTDLGDFGLHDKNPGDSRFHMPHRPLRGNL